MTTFANTERCSGTGDDRCACCKNGKRCSRVLLLAPKDEQLLARLFALGFGKSDRTIQWSAAITARAAKPEPPEPTIEIECERCGEPFSVLAYVVETFKSRGFTPRRCDGCRHSTPARADLA